jgi:hypothetical protein
MHLISFHTADFSSRFGFDAFAKGRHTRECGYPGFVYFVEIPGFPFSRE